MILVALALIAPGVTVSSTGVTMSSTDRPKAGTHAAVAKVECGAFRKNADGSWTSVKASKAGSVSISAGVTLSAGVTVDGVDIGESLDATCSQATKSS
jgi:lipid-binding SYLF domain-containing protein